MSEIQYDLTMEWGRSDAKNKLTDNSTCFLPNTHDSPWKRFMAHTDLPKNPLEWHQVIRVCDYRIAGAFQILRVQCFFFLTSMIMALA